MGIRRSLIVIASLALLLASACAPPDVVPPGATGGGDDDNPTTIAPPHVIGLETDSYRIGETAYFFGDNFLEPDEGRTFLEFEGVYVWEDSDGEPVLEQLSGFTVNPVYDGEFDQTTTVGDHTLAPGVRVLRWSRFGPFDVPFGGQGHRAGVFTGKVRAVNVFTDGTEVRDSSPTDFEIHVEPSILITRLEPVVGISDDGTVRTAECSSPALRVFGGLPYVLEVEAMGFEPKYFIYEVSNVNGENQIAEYTHSASGPVDTLGDPANHPDEIVVFNPISVEDGSAIASIRVTAVDVNDNHYETALPVRIVRPVAFHTDGVRHIAEYYEPVIVHGPLMGAIGTTINYQESQSEARQKGVSVTLTNSFTQSHGSVQSDDWSEAYGVTNTESETNSVGQTHSEGATASETYGTNYNQSQANSVNLSSTDGTSWGWNLVEGKNQSEYETDITEAYGEVSAGVSTEVGAEGSVPGFAKVSGKVGTQLGSKVGGKQGHWTNQTFGSSTSSGTHMDSNSSETKAFGSTTTDSVGTSFSGSYALSAQSTLSENTSQQKGSTESMTYSMGGSDSITENFSTGNTESWQESWQDTTTETARFSMSSKVPNDKCAVVYRQAVRHVRVGNLYNYDLCGVRGHVGELYFNEWSWSPNIAVGDSTCDEEIPASTLPTPTCFMACP